MRSWLHSLVARDNSLVGIELRSADARDQNWLFNLHELAHRELAEAAYGPWIEAEQLIFIRELVEEFETFVVVVENRDVGAVYLGERDGDTWLELIEVDPACQGAGIGASVLHWVVGVSAGRGCGTLLQVHRLNEGALRLYEREGFMRVGQTATHHILRHA